MTVVWMRRSRKAGRNIWPERISDNVVEWDAYFLYGPDVVWDEKPPQHVSWGRTIIGSREEMRRHLPAMRYWQERRADEWAALACGDRLTVASALVATASASSPESRRLVPFPATSLAFYNAPVSSRVRRLVESDDASAFIRLDQISKALFRVGVPAPVLLAALAVYRAESMGLSGIIEITSCDVSLRVERATSKNEAACLRLPAYKGG